MSLASRCLTCVIKTFSVSFYIGVVTHSSFVAREAVTLAEMSAWHHDGTIVQDPVFLKPSIEILIGRHLKAAKKQFGFNQDLLRTPPNLTGSTSSSTATTTTIRPISPFFEGAPEPMSQEEALELTGDSWKVGKRGRGGDRFKGLTQFFGVLRKDD